MPKKEAWAVCRFKRDWQKRGGAVILRKVDTPMYTMTDDWNYSRLFLDAIVAPKWVFFSKKIKTLLFLHVFLQVLPIFLFFFT